MASVTYKTLVSFICDDNFDELRRYLAEKPCFIDDKDEYGGTSLHYAVAEGKIRFVKELLNHKADPNIADIDNCTPLLISAREGNAEICALLMDHGVLIEHRDMSGWTSLMWACYKNHKDVVVVLVSRGANVNVHCEYHVTPLMWASGRGSVAITKILLEHGAFCNVPDKYGSTALIWACRRGDLAIVECLLDAGADVDTSGMYSWTPILVSTMRNRLDIVKLLIDHKANMNTIDKDGNMALTVACREGYQDIALALLEAGAYINVQDGQGDTNLILAVKSGCRAVVDALLKKYADVNIRGRDGKTAVYCAVEKGNLPILKLILNTNPDLEVFSKDGDTALMRAIRLCFEEGVKVLVEAKAKVNISNKLGDTPLHLAMKSRSKSIVEALLSNPKNHQLLYRPNLAGETPYNIDSNQDKPILCQIYGARVINTNTDNENSLGYDLYSCALADILSEPNLCMPITVGLYAKWGSGKSFLLNKLTEEMKNFTRQWLSPMLQFQWLPIFIVLHFVLAISIVVALATRNLIMGSIVLAACTLFFCFVLLVLYFSAANLNMLYGANVWLAESLKNIRTILQIAFCHPPGHKWGDPVTPAAPVKFFFTEQSKVGSTTVGENIVVQMIGSLCDAVEREYGAIPTRLYRAFKPKPLKSSSSWKWRKLCCIPNVVLFELNMLCLTLVGFIFVLNFDRRRIDFIFDDAVTNVALSVCVVFVVFSLASNFFTCARIIKALMTSQHKHIQRAISSLETIKSEGFLNTLRTEVCHMVNMVKCLDGFMQQQTRLVVVVDGLDSCEQDKVLLVLDTVHILFSSKDSPFIIIFSIDPYIISKMVEANTRRLLSECNIGGHDYLRNMVHLPFYLQNSALRRIKLAQKSCLHQKKTAADDVPIRKLSTESNGNVDKLAVPVNGSGGNVAVRSAMRREGSRKLRMTDSIASSISSNLNRMGGAQDLTTMLLSDDYFSDVNPSSMRRLMNVICVTSRLLKSFQIEFNWYHLATWVHITEQWPYRTTCLILYHDANEDSIEENTPLKVLYDKIRPYLPISKEVEPLLEFDRDEKKFDVFLSFHRSSLRVGDMRIFLPCTINLDPYIKKMIREQQQNLEDMRLIMGNPSSHWLNHMPFANANSWYNVRKANLLRKQGLPVALPPKVPEGAYTSPFPIWPMPPPGPSFYSEHPSGGVLQNVKLPPLMDDVPIAGARLSSLDVSGVCELLTNAKDLKNSRNLERYLKNIRHNNISGRVLLHCNVDDLKQALNMNFGDWEMFRMLLSYKREQEQEMMVNLQRENEAPLHFTRMKSFQRQNSTCSLEKRGSFSKSSGSTAGQDPADAKARKKSSVMEKQTEVSEVTLEDHMIIGALQTLNEEACEDVMREETNDDGCQSETPACNMADVNYEGDIDGDADYGDDKDGDDGETNLLFLQNSPTNRSVRAFCPPPCQLKEKAKRASVNLCNSMASIPAISERNQHVWSKSRPSSLILAPSHLLVGEFAEMFQLENPHMSVIRSASVDDTNIRSIALLKELDAEDITTYCSSNRKNPIVRVTAASASSVEMEDTDECAPLMKNSANSDDQFQNKFSGKSAEKCKSESELSPAFEDEGEKTCRVAFHYSWRGDTETSV